MSACTPTPEQATEGPERPGGLVSGLVVRIVDGDTVDLAVGLETITVRLLGINSPESGECFYDEATEYLMRTVDGAEIGIDGQAHDQFGRTLAYLWNGDELMNLTMVEDGFAIATTPEDTHLYGAVFLDSEQTAFESGKGLWGPSVCGASGDVPAIELDPSGHNPTGPDDAVLDKEVIIITNQGPSRVEIGGFTLRDESSLHRLAFPAGSSLDRGQSVQISSADPAWDPDGGPIWNNDGDMALLLDRHGRVVARSRYQP